MGIFRRMVTAFSARSASADLYGQGHAKYNVIPRLDQPHDRERDLPAQEAIDNPLLYGPIYKVAFRMGALPIKVYRLKKDTTSGRMIRQEANDHPAYDVLRHPNDQITRPYLIAGTVQDMFLSRHAAWLKVPVEKPTELWPIDPETIFPITDEQNLFLGLEVKVNGQTVTRLAASSVCYFRLIPSPWSWSAPFTPTVPLSIASDMGFESMDAAAELFSTGILERRWLHSDEEMSEEAFNRVSRQIEAARMERGKMPFLEGPLDIRTMGSGPDDESMIRGMDQSQRLIADMLGLPADGDDKRFFANAIGPVADAIEQELERSLMSDWPRDPAFPEFQFRELLKGSPQERADYHQTLVQSGLEMLDEGRSDLDLPPLPDGAGNRAFIPLNLVDVTDTPQNGVPRQTDTAGGLGGAEQDGRGVLPRVATAWEEAIMRSVGAGWTHTRERVIPSQAGALHRRLIPILRSEMRSMQALVSRVPAARAEGDGQVGLPSLEEVMRVLEISDPELAAQIRRFMAQTSEAAWNAARDLIDAETAEVAARVRQVIDQRVAVAVERFGEIRAGALEDLFQQVIDGAMGMRELADAVSTLYEGSIGPHIADSLARDTVGYAFEQGGVLGWAHAGVAEFDVIFGGGPCTTHVCEGVAASGPYRLGEDLDNVGFSFEGADTPPLHPSCTCFTVPHLGGGIVSATSGGVA